MDNEKIEWLLKNNIFIQITIAYEPVKFEYSIFTLNPFEELECDIEQYDSPKEAFDAAYQYVVSNFLTI
jgi:hypothetical protein